MDRSLSTSGNYERFIRAETRTYGHILDPRSGRPAESVLSATALAPTALETDALSTAFFVLGIEGTRKYGCSNAGVKAIQYIKESSERFQLYKIGFEKPETGEES